MRRVQDYINRAAALRDKAQAVRDETIRDHYVELAKAYEELAEAIQTEKGRRPKGAAS